MHKRELFWLQALMLRNLEPNCFDNTLYSIAGFLQKFSWLPLTSLVMYRFCNNLGLGPLPWLINGEVFSEEAKGASSSVVTVTHWLAVFFVTHYAAALQVTLVYRRDK